MPLIKSSSKKAVSDNIREMVRAGHPQAQAVAASLDNQRRMKAKGLARGGMALVPYSGGTLDHSHGLIPGSAGGRADTIKMKVPHGSYVVPADVVSGLGGGNTISGAKALDHTFPGSPNRSIQGRAHVRGFAPLMHSPFAAGFHTQTKLAHGGQGGAHILGSSGEYVISPEALIRKYGSLKRAHAILDHFVVGQRSKNIKTLKNMKPPVGSKQARKK